MSICSKTYSGKLLLHLVGYQSLGTSDDVGQGTVTLFGKPTDQEDVRLVSQGTILPELDFRILLN